MNASYSKGSSPIVEKKAAKGDILMRDPLDWL